MEPYCVPPLRRLVSVGVLLALPSVALLFKPPYGKACSTGAGYPTCACDQTRCPDNLAARPSCDPCNSWCIDHCKGAGGGSGGGGAAGGAVGSVLNQQAGNLGNQMGAAAGAAIGNWIMGGSKKEPKASGPSPEELAAQREAERRRRDAEAQRRAEEEQKRQAAQRSENEKISSEFKPVDGDDTRAASDRGQLGDGSGFKSLDDEPPHPVAASPTGPDASGAAATVPPGKGDPGLNLYHDLQVLRDRTEAQAAGLLPPGKLNECKLGRIHTRYPERGSSSAPAYESQLEGFRDRTKSWVNLCRGSADEKCARLFSSIMGTCSGPSIEGFQNCLAGAIRSYNSCPENPPKKP
jgi:hypothetical protein